MREGQVVSGHQDRNTDTGMTAPAPAHSPPPAPPRPPIGRPGPSLASHWSGRRPARPEWRGLSWLWPAGLIPSLILSSVHKAQARAELTGPGTSPAIPIQWVSVAETRAEPLVLGCPLDWEEQCVETVETPVSGEPSHQLTSPTPDSETVTPEDDLRQTVRR